MVKYPEDIMRDVRQNLGLEEADTSQDTRINNMSPDEVLDRVVTWAGLINYGGTIRRWIQGIYGIKLGGDPNDSRRD